MAVRVGRFISERPTEWGVRRVDGYDLMGGGNTPLMIGSSFPYAEWPPEPGTARGVQRAWAVPSLFVCDGSVMPTQGAANPALTIMARASRLAERLASGAVGRGAARASVGA